LTREEVIKEARSWLGTRFRDCARIKGVGVDCGQFLCAVYNNSIETPPYNHQFMMNCIDELYIDAILKYAREIKAEEAQRADVVVLKCGHVYSHGAILLEPWPGQIIHALNGFGVIISDAKRDGRLLATMRKHHNFPPRFFRPLDW